MRTRQLSHWIATVLPALVLCYAATFVFVEARPSPSADSKSLFGALQSAADSQNRVVITFTNAAYLQMTSNWLHFAKQTGITNEIVFALDKEAHANLSASGVRTFFIEDAGFEAAPSESSVFGSESFRAVVRKKPRLLKKVMELGFNVLLSDSDVIFLQNPFETVIDEKMSLGIMTDAHFGVSKANSKHFLNSGFMYMKALDINIHFIERVVELLDSRPEKMDQDAVLAAISSWKGEPLPLTVFDEKYVCNGWMYFLRRVHQDQMPVAIHNNWADGNTGSFQQKLFRFREAGLWSLDGSEHFDTAKNYLTIEIPPNSRDNIWLQMKYIYQLLLLARMSSRIAVLPQIVCGGEAKYCLADTLFQVAELWNINSKWAKEGSGLRESSYIHKPEAPACFMNPQHANLPSSEGNLLSEKVVANVFSRNAGFQCLHLSGNILGVQGFDNPVNQLFTRKELLTALQPSFYITEAAKRIRIEAAPEKCVAVHLDQFATGNSHESLNWLTLQIQQQLPASVSRDCVFISTSTGFHRSASHFASLRQAFKKSGFRNVVGIAENEMQYPLDDLWRMQGHSLVNMVEAYTIARLSEFVFFDEHDPFVKKCIELRFDFGPFRNWKVYMSAEMKRPLIEVKEYMSSAPPCPVPDWHDYRMLCDMGFHLESLGIQGAALRCLESASNKYPNESQVAIWFASSLLNAEKYKRAAKEFNRAFSLQQDAALAINEGVAYQRLGDHDNAVRAYRKALQQNDTFAEAHHNLGSSLDDLGRFQEAVQSYQNALKINPTFALTYSALGRSMLHMNKRSDAARMFAKAEQLEPANEQFALDYGQVLHDMGQFEQEQQVYKKLIERAPAAALAYSYFATSITSAYQVKIGYRSYGKEPEDQAVIDQAYDLYAKSIDINPHCGMCYGQQADLMKDAHRVAEAIKGYRISAMLSPNAPTIYCNYVYTKFFACDWEDYDQDFEKLLQMIDNENMSIKKSRAPSPVTLPEHQCVLPLMGVLYRKVGAERLLDTTRLYVERITKGIFALPQNFNLPSSPRRLRVAFLSADFKDHPVAKRMQHVYSNIDRSRVHAFAFSLNKGDNSEWRIQAENGIETFLDVVGIFERAGEAAVAQEIANSNIDVLVNLAGHTRGNDMVTRICAYRPAPSQLMHLGYAGSMGGSLVNQHITDCVTSPVDYRAHYDEGLFYMPGSFFVNDYPFTYKDLADHFVTRSMKSELLQFGGIPRADEASVLFSCFNQMYKVDPGIFSRWMNILRRLPNAAMWMIRIHTTEPEKQFKAAAQAQGVDFSRFFMRQGYSEDQHLRVKSAADLFLDTPSYNAHSTGTDALWAGVPILTLPEEKMGSRVAAGLLRAVGLPELSMRNEQDYEDVAVFLGNHPDVLAKIKHKLAKIKKNSLLFNLRRWIADEIRGMRMSVEASWNGLGNAVSFKGSMQRHPHIVISSTAYKQENA